MVRTFGFDTESAKLLNAASQLKPKLEIVLDSAANVYVDEVKRLAPRSQKIEKGKRFSAKGTYRDSIKVVESGEGYRIIASDYWVMSISTGKEYNLGQILEFGAVAHDIMAVLGQTLMWIGEDGIPHFAKKVHHPYQPPQPHFHPAIYVLKSKFPNIFLQVTMVIFK